MRVLAVVLGAVLTAACSSSGQPPAGPPAASDPRSDGDRNVRLVGYHDLQGRQSLVVTAKSDPANGNWVYVGHTPNDRADPQASDDGQGTDQPILNPLTGAMEWNGTSIVEISDPAKPRLVWHIPNDQAHVNSRSVSVVYDYGSGAEPKRDYLIRSYDTGTILKFQVFDITARDSDPSKIALVSEITGTPPGNCGTGCGGPFVNRAHKGWWSQRSGLFYSSAGEPGFRGLTVIHIWDLKDPRHPRFVGRAASPAQRDGQPGYQNEYAHHPIVDEPNDRLYIGFRGAGLAGGWDISNPSSPKLVWMIDTSPPGRGPHTVSPIRYEQVPNFKGPDGLPRTYAFITDEAAGAADMKPCASGIRTKAYMVDITDETHPFPVSTWQVPVGDFCEKGGRFGPHQHAETVNGEINRFENRLAWVAYFNAGVRVVDLSDPYNLKEVGYYVPKANALSHPITKGQPTAIQINDVDIDHRGLAYASDRVGSGLFILEYTGQK